MKAMHSPTHILEVTGTMRKRNFHKRLSAFLLAAFLLFEPGGFPTAAALEGQNDLPSSGSEAPTETKDAEGEEKDGKTQGPGENNLPGGESGASDDGSGEESAIGTAGVSGAGMIMLAMVLEAINIPVAYIGLIVAVDRLFDMGRTCLNVTGDIACAVCVTHWEAKKKTKTAKK